MFPVRQRRVVALTAAVALIGMTTACGSNDSDSGAGGSADQKPSGDILVLTNRTDVVNTTFQDYKKKFEAKYPGVQVKFQAISDYEGEVKTRMSTKQYGDVLLIPAGVAKADYADFFEPLGKAAELGKKYRFVDSASVAGTTYGLATFGNATGIVYNKKVFKQAGITALPKTPDEFIADLQAIKVKTPATPYYTNYKDGWPLQWSQGFLGSVSGDKDALVKMASNTSPWAQGQEKYALDTLLFDSVQKGLTEKDPTTTNWETSKNLIATGKIGVMPLGTWAIAQMKEAATKAGTDPADIGFMPPPFQADGAYQSPVAQDFNMAINVNSQHKAAARAWVDWMIKDSGYSDEVGGLPTLRDGKAPADLKNFEAAGVKFVEMTPSPKIDAVDKQSEIGLTQPDYYRQLVDAARGASGKTKQQIFDGLNSKWSDAITKVG
ncbi:MAG: extracellular solute-binding protein [Terracoccus sp.]